MRVILLPSPLAPDFPLFHGVGNVYLHTTYTLQPVQAGGGGETFFTSTFPSPALLLPNFSGNNSAGLGMLGVY